MSSAKERILTAAKKFFALKGFETTSVREIAKEAEVNLAAINYHFRSKEELFQNICCEFGEKKLSLVFSLFNSVEDEKDMKVKLMVFMKTIYSYGVEDSDTLHILLKNIDLFANKSPEDFKRLFLEPHDRLARFFEEAQTKGIIRKDLEPEIIANIIHSGVIDSIRFNSLRKKFYGRDIMDESEQQKFIDNYLKCFIEGIRS